MRRLFKKIGNYFNPPGLTEEEASQLEIGRRYLVSGGPLDAVYYTGILSHIDPEGERLTLVDGEEVKIWGWMGWSGSAQIREYPFETKQIPFDEAGRVKLIDRGD